MNEYVSTYQKDFNWPYVKTFPIRTERQPYQTPITSHCICGSEPGGAIPPKEYVGPIEGDNYQWSRLGPMAPLLDPKLYPAKVGPAPEFEIMRYDQPNTYLKKLQERYPYLYNVLQSAPPDELIRRVNEDRLRTTYQMDYSHMEEHPSADYEKLLARAGVSVCSKMRSSPKENLPILDCRAKLRPPEYDAPVQPNSLTIKILAVNDAGGFPMGPRGEENQHRDFEYNSTDIENDYHGPGHRPRDMENDQDRSRNDYDDPKDRIKSPRNVPDRNDHRDPKNGAKRVENLQDRPVNDHRNRENNSKGKTTPGGARETTPRGNGFKGDQSSGTNAAKGKGGYGAEGRGGRGDGGGGYESQGARATDAGGARGGSRPTDAGGAGTGGDGGRGPRANEGGGEGGGGRVDETGGGGGGEKGNEGGGGGRPSRKSVGFGVEAKNDGKSNKAHKAKEDEEASKKPLPPWKSEYQEVIGQTGMHIIKDKMHQHGGRSSGRKLMERIIMKCRT